jgi:hypothetical protein
LTVAYVRRITKIGGWLQTGGSGFDPEAPVWHLPLMEGERMTKKKGVRIIISGVQRRTIEVDAMAQIVIALGRELAERKPEQIKLTNQVAKTGAET